MSLSPRSNTSLLKPMAALATWTFFMEAWMYKARLPAIKKYKIDPNPNTITAEMQAKVPIEIRQIADNYNNLHEQPQVFYAVSLALTLLGDGHPYTRVASWGYVGLRVVHSLWQSLSNYIPARFGIFASSSLVLAGLTARLGQLLF